MKQTQTRKTDTRSHKLGPSQKRKKVNSTKSMRPKAKKAGLKTTRPKSTKTGWDNVHEFLRKAERKVDQLSKSVVQSAERFGAGTEKQFKNFESRWSDTQEWLDNQLLNIRVAELSVETFFDTARVKAHLAKMDGNDAISDLLERAKRITNKVDELAVKTGLKSSRGLKKLSMACDDVQQKLTN